MKSLIIVNPADCIGCRTCEVACVVAHPSEQELNADIFLPPAEGTTAG
ncbi:oxidoreductase [Escherichia coli]|nr:oxidoreductase [Escherichia coli]